MNIISELVNFYLTESELKSLKSVNEYNRYFLDQAEDDVDRLLIVEGNITWFNGSSIKNLIIEIFALTFNVRPRMYERAYFNKREYNFGRIEWENA